jgi:hypothetical protein
MQMTQATNLPKAKPKIVFDIGCDHLAPSMAIVLFIHALHFAKAYDESEAPMAIRTRHSHQK